jgi:hypothetical protein
MPLPPSEPPPVAGGRTAPTAVRAAAVWDPATFAFASAVAACAVNVAPAFCVC